jgi:hypothetical protein
MTGRTFEGGFDRNLLTICPIGGMERGVEQQKPYFAGCRTASAGLLTPSSPVSVRIVSSRFAGRTS